MMMHRLVTFSALAMSLLAHAATACDGLSATGAWIREPPPVASVAAGYVSLKNTGDNPLSIEHIESDCCGSIMMHDNVNDGDRVRMVHLDSLRLAAGETVEFTPGAKHLMLMAPRKPLRDGDSLVLNFVCGDGTTTRVEFAVVKVQ
jgi:copper(I)-binding protein